MDAGPKAQAPSAEGACVTAFRKAELFHKEVLIGGLAIREGNREVVPTFGFSSLDRHVNHEMIAIDVIDVNLRSRLGTLELRLTIESSPVDDQLHLLANPGIAVDTVAVKAGWQRGPWVIVSPWVILSAARHRETKHHCGYCDYHCCWNSQ